MADSRETSVWERLDRMAWWWLGLCMGIYLGWLLTHWPAVFAVVDQYGDGAYIFAFAILAVVGLIPGLTLGAIDHIRRIRQKVKDAAAWRDKKTQ